MRRLARLPLSLLSLSPLSRLSPLSPSAPSPLPSPAFPQDRRRSKSRHGTGGLSQPICQSLGGVGVGLDGVGASSGGGPGEGAWVGLGEVPAGVLLDLMVEPADATEVARAGTAALVERDRVVKVAPGSGLPAGEEPAGQVPRRDVLPQLPGGPVGLGGRGVRAPACSLCVARRASRRRPG